MLFTLYLEKQDKNTKKKCFYQVLKWGKLKNILETTFLQIEFAMYKNLF